MKYIKSYKLFELALGIAEATLIYNKFLLNEFNKQFEESITQGVPEYSNTIFYSKEDLSDFINDKSWYKFPVQSMSVTYIIDRMSDQKWVDKYTNLTKKYYAIGGCQPIGTEEGDSSLKPAINDKSNLTIHLAITIGAKISESFNDMHSLSIEIESVIAHELNHAYEVWSRYKLNKKEFSTDVTWALDVNRARVKKEIWRFWNRNIAYLIYLSEKIEINAMVHESWPYVEKYELEEMKDKSPVWKWSEIMKSFNSNEFKKELSEMILSYYPDADVDFYIKRIKNAFANQLNSSKSPIKKTDKPSILAKDIKEMSVDEFLKLMENRINQAGIKLQRKVLRLYSLKKNRKNENS